jgi:hypothetical protein
MLRTELVSWLAVEVLLFAAASLVHAGVPLGGYEHSRAMIAEGVLATVLLLGLTAVWVHPRSAPSIAVGVQVFALLGTVVGAFTIAIGVGPQTRADAVYHGILLLVLALGVVRAVRMRGRPRARA